MSTETFKGNILSQWHYTILKPSLTLCIEVFCLRSCLCTIYMPDACGGQQRASDLLELKSQTVESCHVGAWNQTCVLWKSSQCSRLLCHLSRPTVSLYLKHTFSVITFNFCTDFQLLKLIPGLVFFFFLNGLCTQYTSLLMVVIFSKNWESEINYPSIHLDFL